MKHVIPGGHYSYDAARKKIWLSYEYYDLGIENIDSIRNLTRNMLLYDVRKPTRNPVTVENGCITHSYQGTEADTDKIQITLRTPIQDSLTELEAVDGVISLETTGKKLVLPSGNADVLPLFNEWAVKPTLLTLAESPFGGYKGTPADYCVGTISTPTDGVYLQDLTGQNSSKTLGAGKLKELSLMSVDVVNHTITEEFQVANTSESNNQASIDLTTGWAAGYSSGGELSYADGTITLSGATADSTGRSAIVKNVGVGYLENKYFLKFSVRSSVSANIYCLILNATSTVYKIWGDSRFAIPANTWKTVVLPVLAPVGSTGLNPTSLTGVFNVNDVTRVVIGVRDAGNGANVTINVRDVTTDIGKSAYIETQVPDHLSATSLSLYTHDGTAYQLCSSHSLDGAYSQISQTSANCTYLDGTKLDDAYGAAGAGRAVFPKGSAGETKNGSSGSITYSNNLGTDKRVALKIDLPPSDNGRTNFNKVRLKLVVNYTTDAGGIRSATHIFADSTNASYGLQNLALPFIALYDPATSLIDFYLFSHRPQNLTFKRNESGVIYELNLYSGAGSVYHGQITYADLVADSDSDYIPDCLEADLNGSLTKFLQNYTMVI